MAPSAVSPARSYTDLAIEMDRTSDAMDEINILKANLLAQRKKESTYEASKFDSEKDKTQFRRFENANATVVKTYTEQHTKQTVEFNTRMRREFQTQERARMSVWAAMEMLDEVKDDSDPDTSLSQIQHLLQAAEAMRRDGKPRWMQVTGLIHDLGKLLIPFGVAEGQWDVVGDTFPVGCAFDPSNCFHSAFENNPDFSHPIYSKEFGMYSPHCGLDNIMLSWGHDEYLYHVVKSQSTLPDEALAMIRYHSFYPWHTHGAYREFMNEKDEKMLEAVKAFNPYDLYSKSDGVPDVKELRPYYEELIDEFFPVKEIRW